MKTLEKKIYLPKEERYIYGSEAELYDIISKAEMPNLTEEEKQELRERYISFYHNEYIKLYNDYIDLDIDDYVNISDIKRLLSFIEDSEYLDIGFDEIEEQASNLYEKILKIEEYFAAKEEENIRYLRREFQSMAI